MQVKNLRSYTPEFREGESAYNEALGHAIAAGAVWYKTEDGQDYYTIRNACTDLTSWKLAYGQDGRVFSASQDIMQVVVHEGTSIIEVSELPENFNTHYFWFIKDGELVEDLEKVQTAIRGRMLDTLDASISILQNRVDDEDATEEHIAELERQRSVRVALRKLDMKVKVDVWPSV